VTGLNFTGARQAGLSVSETAEWSTGIFTHNHF